MNADNNAFTSWEEAVAWLLIQPDKQNLVRDCYYDSSPEEAAKRYSESEEWLAINTLLPKVPSRVLDLGAGRGIASFALAKEGWDVVALEPDPSNLVGGGAICKIAQVEGLPIEVVQEYGEHIPCDSNSFALVFARQALHHADNLPLLCAEVFRLLKPGGSFIAVRDHIISSKNDLDTFLKIHPLHYLYGGENAYQTKQYLTALRNAGFRVKKVLRSFDSVINYAPYTRNSLREDIKRRVRRIPLGRFIGNILNIEVIMDLSLFVMSWIDRRPGRLYSFVCVKPQS
jgi:SAM-dependent methyltransferase